MGLRVGDDVLHDKFGEGVVLALHGSGDKAEAVVNFREVGEKRLLLAWAPLQKLGLIPRSCVARICAGLDAASRSGRVRGRGAGRGGR